MVIRHMDIRISRALKLVALLIALSVMMGGVACASDWMMQITIRSGPDEAYVRIGSQLGATDWYDDALDAPTPMARETFNACLYHPEWDVTIDGVKQDCFSMDIRFSLPQDYDISIEGGSGPVTLSWNRADIPEDGEFWLYDAGSETWVDMSKQASYTYTPSKNSSRVTVRATWGDTCCYPLPSQ